MEKPSKFTLEPTDPQAPGSIRYWAQRIERRIERGTLPKGMASEAKAARSLAAEMDKYQAEKRDEERAAAKAEKKPARKVAKKAVAPKRKTRKSSEGAEATA